MSFSFASEISRSECPKKPSKQRSNKSRRSPKCSKKCRNEKRMPPCWSSGSKGVAERLDALKGLIPSMGNENEMTADEIFEGTADYIVLLRSRVEILKHLVEFYGNIEPHEENAPVS